MNTTEKILTLAAYFANQGEDEAVAVLRQVEGEIEQMLQDLDTCKTIVKDNQKIINELMTTLETGK